MEQEDKNQARGQQVERVLHALGNRVEGSQSLSVQEASEGEPAREKTGSDNNREQIEDAGNTIFGSLTQNQKRGQGER